MNSFAPAAERGWGLLSQGDQWRCRTISRVVGNRVSNCAQCNCGKLRLVACRRGAVGPRKASCVSRFAFHYEKLAVKAGGRKVFDDPRRLRLRRLRAALVIALLMAGTWAYLFLDGALSWQTAWQEVRGRWTQQEDVLRLSDDPLQHPEDLRLASLLPVRPTRPTCEAPSQPFFAAMASPSAATIFGHVPSDTDWGQLSLNESCNQLGVLVPDWLRLETTPEGPVVKIESEESRAPLVDYRSTSGHAPDLMPVLEVDTGSDKAGFLRNLSTPETAQSVTSQVLAQLRPLYAQGACISIPGLETADLDVLQPFFKTLTSSLRSEGHSPCLILSGTSTAWQSRETTALFDKVILKLFLDPWVGTAPSPLATDAWFEKTAKAALQEIGKDKLVIALGTFAVEWVSGEPLPKVLPYAAAMEKIAAAGAELRFSEKTSGSLASYRDPEGRLNKIWMQDVASLINQLVILQQLEIPNSAIWSLGLEDPGIWSVLQNRDLSHDALSADLALVKLDSYVSYRGEGALLRLDRRQSPGIRQIGFDPETGRVVSQSYDLMPRPYALERYGKPAGRKVVLTFDDGPHPVFSEQILDILQETQTPATFFVTGKSVMNAPEVLNRMIDEGHEIGAHTFSHPRMDQVSKTRATLEYAMLDKVVAGAAGRQLTLYREPFQRSGGPVTADRVAALEIAWDRDMQVVGMDVVPHDWAGWSGREIADFAIKEVERGAGNVILLHDGGEDRTASVEATRLIITELSAKGYEFTTVADLTGSTRAAVMPVTEGGYQTFDRVSFSLVAWGQDAIVILFWLALGIGVVRSVAILLLAVLNWRGHRTISLTTPKVAVIIPAHNEEKVIRSCIQSVRASDYKNLEIIVVDDGSSDNTLNEIFAFSHMREVRLISQPNQGKWSALNRALMNTSAEIVVCIDADTQIEKSAIGHMVRHFDNPRIGAVAGKIIAGNKVNLLTRLQALEYTTAQNVERKAFDLINGMLVVPGALGAWRVAALRKAGHFSDETMTEDTDLTIEVNRAGYRIAYEPLARGYTEVPERIGQLLKQRLRWSFGMFQSAWKHKKAMFEGRSVGLISIPDMFIFGYLFPLLAPIADLFVAILLYQMVSGGWDSGAVGAQNMQYLLAYLTLPALEFVIAAFALARDKDESMWSLLLFPVQRVLYRPILYYSVIRAILRAITGRLFSWGAQKRLGRDYSLATSGT